jgi:transcriptional regulator with XRE-family HTH domain
MPAADPQPMRQLAANLRRAIARRGLLPADVAACAGIDLAKLHAILRGERVVRLDTLVRLAGALGVAPENLLDGIRWIPDGEGGGRYEARTSR